MPQITASENITQLELCSQRELISCIKKDDVVALENLNYTLEMFYECYKTIPLAHHLLNENAIKILKHLIAKGLNIEIKDKDNASLLHYVNTVEQAKILLDAGAKFDEKDIEGETVLHTFVYKFFYNKDILLYLLESGANVNAQNDNGDTPLHIAAKQDEHQSIEILIRLNANLDIKNNEGQSALDIAPRETYQYMIRLNEEIKRKSRLKMKELESRVAQLEELVTDLKDILSQRQSPVSTARRLGLFKA